MGPRVRGGDVCFQVGDRVGFFSPALGLETSVGPAFAGVTSGIRVLG